VSVVSALLYARPMTERATYPRALVLGGGGVTGIAWEIGLLAGLQEAGVDLTGADLVVGTSAGSVVGAQITTGQTLDQLYRRQLEPPTGERAAKVGPRVLAGWVVAALLARGNFSAFGRRVGRASIRAAAAGRTQSLDERLAVISSRLPVHTWPDRDLRITTIDALSGEFRVLTSESGVDLVTAVAASCAVPSVSPPVLIDGRPHIDGGMKSAANVDLASGAERVVVLAPTPGGFSARASAAAQAAAWPADRALVLSPDASAVRAIGRNVLDPAARAAAARAGRAQAVTSVDAVRAVWNA
jgi:NTE family protein